MSEPAPTVSVVIPCLNEATSIDECVTRARTVLAGSGLASEVIVVDNGSDDGSGALAAAAGATVVVEPKRGYGNAYLAGFAAARGDYVVMIDADLTYDATEIPAFVAELQHGADLVVGNRLEGLQPGSMHWLNRAGNALLSGLLNMLFRTPISDVHCGLRAIRRDALARLDLQSGGMELASEMIIRAVREHLVIRELPIALHPRAGESKLSRFRDGWRHLRLILVYNPTFLFLVPGVVLLVVGAVLMLLVLANVTVSGHGVFVHTLIGASLLVVVGTQLIGFGLCARTLRRLPARRPRPVPGGISAPADARARSGARDTRLLRGAGHRRYRRRPVGRRRVRAAGGGAAVGGRGHTRDRRDADLLHVVPALDHGPEAPGRLTDSPGCTGARWRSSRPPGRLASANATPPISDSSVASVDPIPTSPSRTTKLASRTP